MHDIIKNNTVLKRILLNDKLTLSEDFYIEKSVVFKDNPKEIAQEVARLGNHHNDLYWVDNIQVSFYEFNSNNKFEIMKKFKGNDSSTSPWWSFLIGSNGDECWIIDDCLKSDIPHYRSNVNRIVEEVEYTKDEIFNNVLKSPYDVLLIKINNHTEKDKLLSIINKYYYMNHLLGSDNCYIWLFLKEVSSWSPLNTASCIYSYIDSGGYLHDYSSEKFYPEILNMDDITTVENTIQSIFTNTKIIKSAKEMYKPKQILESTNHKRYEYNYICVITDNSNEFRELQEYLFTIGFKWSGDNRFLKFEENSFPICMHISLEYDKLSQLSSHSNMSYIDTIEYFNTFNKSWNISNKLDKTLYYFKDNIYRTILRYGSKGPSYKPKKFEEKTMKLSFNDFLLLEKSSLTKLGVPTEVMQPIQRDFAIPANAQWDRLKLKRDVIKILRKGNKELILQISTDSIKIFVANPLRDEIYYTIDRYLLDEDANWSGEYIQAGRESVSMTQLFSEIESGSIIYKLKDEFSLTKQNIRKLARQNKKFSEFTKNFKIEFLKNFNNILKRIVGKNFNDAKEEINDKAKRIEIENNMIISGLDSTIEGPNGLTILDEFIMQFENAYSEFFEEHVDIYELSKYFTKEKMMTAFMYFVYTGKTLQT